MNLSTPLTLKRHIRRRGSVKASTVFVNPFGMGAAFNVCRASFTALRPPMHTCRSFSRTLSRCCIDSRWPCIFFVNLLTSWQNAVFPVDGIVQEIIVVICFNMGRINTNSFFVTFSLGALVGGMKDDVVSGLLGLLS